MIQKRREKIINSLEANSMLLLYSNKAPKKSADQLYPYEVNRNFYYLTGINQSDSYLLIIKGETTLKTILFLESRDPKRALWDGEVLDFEVAKKLSGVDEVLENMTLDDYLAQVLSSSRANKYGEIKNFYFDLERLKMADEKIFSEALANKYANLYPHLIVKNIHNELAYLRSIKDETEVALIKEAINITKAGIYQMFKKAEPGQKEYQIEAYYNFILNWHGVKPSFKTIAGSGKNGTILHYVDNNSVTKDGDLILCDLGVQYELYCSDITRTFPVNGKFSKRQKEIYEMVLKCNKAVINYLKPGLTWQEVNDYAKDILAQELIKDGKIAAKEELVKYYYHSIGHFLGLDVHDVGNYNLPLEAGQIVTVEPGLYFEDENIGIRIEDNVLITADGAINLSAEIVKEVSEIEKLIQKLKENCCKNYK